MSDNVSTACGSVASDCINGTHYQRVKVTFGGDGSAADVSSDNPLPVTLIGGSSSGLTDAQLRASPVPVSGSFYLATQPISGTVSVSGSVAVTGSFYQATQPVSIASMPSTPVTGTFWQATQPVSGTVTANVNGTVPVSGTFWQATQPVSGPLTDTQLRAAAVPVSGTFWQATQPVSIANMPSTPVTGTFWQATQPVSGTVTITPPALTKATQGSTGLSTQDLKDAGRVSVCIATVIGGVTAVTTEALLSMVKVSDGVAAGGATSFAVTSGKRLRIQAIHVSARSTSAAVLSARFALRMNPSGAAVATSPILAILSCAQQAAALAEAGDGQVLSIPDGLEISGTQQIGLTQVCSATTGSVYATIIGYEY